MEDRINLVDYSRQAAMDEILFSNTYKERNLNVIVGCGGIGFWLATMLAMVGMEQFVLIDGDSISASNLNRLPVPQTWIGINKAVALKRTIRFMRPTTIITAVKVHINADTIEPVITGIIDKTEQLHALRQQGFRCVVKLWDTTDDARIQTKLYKYSQTISNVQYLKIGYDGFNIGAYPSYDVWFDEATYQPGYRTSTANALSSAMSACLGILKMFKGDGEDTQVNLLDVVNKPQTSEGYPMYTIDERGNINV